MHRERKDQDATQQRDKKKKHVKHEEEINVKPTSHQFCLTEEAAFGTLNLLFNKIFGILSEKLHSLWVLGT